MTTESTARTANWDEICPDGALRYYEGDDPDGFAAEMLELYNLDVRAPRPAGWEGRTSWDSEFEGEPDRIFYIPPGLVEEIYGAGHRWPIGS
jgi:hypothetical protein